MRDESTGDVIVKLVNLLPITVKMNIDLSSLDKQVTTARRTLLTGKDMNDRHARPSEDVIQLPGLTFGQELPAYSLTVIRL